MNRVIPSDKTRNGIDEVYLSSYGSNSTDSQIEESNNVSFKVIKQNDLNKFQNPVLKLVNCSHMSLTKQFMFTVELRCQDDVQPISYE